MFDFETDLEQLDERSKFVNKICKLLYDKFNGDLNEAITYDKQLFNDIDYHIKNIYQFVENEIPLYAYYRLSFYGPEDYDLTLEEYQEAMNKTINACLLYYENKT